MSDYRITEAAEILGRSVNTLRNWEITGKLVPHHKSEGGHRVYTEEQLRRFLIENGGDNVKYSVGYVNLTNGLFPNADKMDVERFYRSLGIDLLLYDITSDNNYIMEEGFEELLKMIESNNLYKVVIFNEVPILLKIKMLRLLCKEKGIQFEIYTDYPDDEEYWSYMDYQYKEHLDCYTETGLIAKKDFNSLYDKLNNAIIECEVHNHY